MRRHPRRENRTGDVDRLPHRCAVHGLRLEPYRELGARRLTVRQVLDTVLHPQGMVRNVGDGDKLLARERATESRLDPFAVTDDAHVVVVAWALLRVLDATEHELVE